MQINTKRTGRIGLIQVAPQTIPSVGAGIIVAALQPDWQRQQPIANVVGRGQGLPLPPDRFNVNSSRRVFEELVELIFFH